jgi:hypothetical protein
MVLQCSCKHGPTLFRNEEQLQKMMADPNRDELNYKCLKCKTPVTSLRILDCDIIMSNSRRISSKSKSKSKESRKRSSWGLYKQTEEETTVAILAVLVEGEQQGC